MFNLKAAMLHAAMFPQDFYILSFFIFSQKLEVKLMDMHRCLKK